MMVVVVVAAAAAAVAVAVVAMEWLGGVAESVEVVVLVRRNKDVSLKEFLRNRRLRRLKCGWKLD